MKMKKNKSKAILSFLILWTVINTGFLLKQTYSPNIDQVTLKTKNGATVRKEIESNSYGLPIEGTYLVHGPKDQKYSLNENIRPRVYTILVSSILAFITFLITVKNEEKENSRTRR